MLLKNSMFFFRKFQCFKNSMFFFENSNAFKNSMFFFRKSNAFKKFDVFFLRKFNSYFLNFPPETPHNRNDARNFQIPLTERNKRGHRFGHKNTNQEHNTRRNNRFDNNQGLSSECRRPSASIRSLQCSNAGYKNAAKFDPQSGGNCDARTVEI